ncbi:unnamed protein product [Brassica oleracea var. botrytis]|uniref:(rape) hypothetical protein n=1 Tax=Brassica napus TaxID=3708 RepID=A0A816JGH5_BRANA|nr:unnamed protein product [Brassica napus]
MSFFLEPKLFTAEIMVKKLGTPFQLLQIGTEEERDEKPSQKIKRGKNKLCSQRRLKSMDTETLDSCDAQFC